MKKGFTLIELLAVIIILAVIALIATPIVLDVVESAKRSAFESTTYGMIDAMKLKSAEDMIDGNSMAKEYTFPSTELDVQGSQLTGTGKVDKEGRLAIAVNNGKWCATKGFTDGIITVKDYVDGECTLSTEEDSSEDDVCYDIEVVSSYDINLEKCVDFITDEGYSWDDESDYEKYCTKGQYPSDGIYSLETEIRDGYWDIYYLIDEGVLENVQYENQCLSCFETQSYLKSYDINLEKCMAYAQNVHGHNEENAELYCTKGEITSRGTSLEIDIVDYYSNVYTLIEEGILENVVYDRNRTTITGYRCYADNPYGMPEITDIVIPNILNGSAVTVITEYSFYYSGLTSVDFSKSTNLTIIGDSAFDGNQISGSLDLSGLTKLERIGKGAFDQNKIDSVNFSGLTNLKTIDHFAFRWNHLTGVVDLSSSSDLEIIGDSAFQANNLEQIKLPTSVTSIGSYAFSSSDKIYDIPKTLPDGSMELIEYYDNPNLTKIVNPTGKEFNWNYIILGKPGTPFNEGTVTTATGTVRIDAK